MEAPPTHPINPQDLPQDLSVCHEMIQQLVESCQRSQQENDQLRHRIDELLRSQYGPRSEKADEAQLQLFTELLGELQSEVDAPPPPEELTAKPGRGRLGRRCLPENLPRHQQVHDVPAEELSCPCCGQMRERFGEDVTEQLNYTPASVFVVEHVRPKYVCKHCEAHVVIGEKPTQPIEKGLPGPGLLAQIAVSKFADHLPLYRLERIFKRHGVHIARSTSCGWMAQLALLLGPLYVLMISLVLRSKVLHTDDTPVPVQEKGRGKTRQGRIWTYVGDEGHPYTVFDYTATRSRNGPARFLETFNGYLQADAYSAYDAIYSGLAVKGRVVEVACWAHTRRYFRKSLDSDVGGAHEAMAWIGRLYAVEKAAQRQELDAEGRRRLRQQEAVPVLNDFKLWLDKKKLQVLPKSPMGEAIGYTLSNWDALVRYTEDGDLNIDNNAAENALRGICLGRKNWQFVGNDKGGRTAAVLLSVITSCNRHGVDPFTYLEDVIARISDHPMKRLEELLPDRWKTAREAESAQPSPPHARAPSEAVSP